MEWLWLAMAGVAAGIFGGLLGVGGATVMLPAMLWILGTQYGGILGYTHPPREGIHQYQAASLIVTSLLILPSVRVHLKNRAVWTGVLKWLVPTALLGGAAGVALTRIRWLQGPNANYMRYLMGAFFVYVALENIRRLFIPRTGDGVSRKAAERYPWWRKSVVGVPTGLFAGLLGIGGGAVAVPGQQAILRMPLRNSIATSAATILCTNWAFAILRNATLGADGQWQHSLLLAGLLTPTAMLGGHLGGHLTHRLPLAWIRVAFIGLMAVSAVKAFS